MKKTLLTAAVAAASFVGLTAFAGGGAVMPAQHNTFAYVELNTGFANKHLGQLVTGDDFNTYSRTNSVWTVGGDLGYQFINNLALELGGNWMQAARWTQTLGNTSTTRNLNSWVAYLAGKMSVPVYDHLSVFAKAGLGYQRESGSWFDALNREDSDTSLQNSAWVPVFAVGANYDVNHNVFAGVQYMRFGSQFRSTDTRNWSFTAKDLFTASLGYKFQM